MPVSKSLLAIGLECLKSAAHSAKETYSKYSTPPKVKKLVVTPPPPPPPPRVEAMKLEDLLREECGIPPEELEEGASMAEVESQLGGILKGTESVRGDDFKLTANELMLSSKCFIIIATNDVGDVKMLEDFRRASTSDVAAIHVICSQVSEELYAQISDDRVYDGEDEDEDGTGGF